MQYSNKINNQYLYLKVFASGVSDTVTDTALLSNPILDPYAIQKSIFIVCTDLKTQAGQDASAEKYLVLKPKNLWLRKSDSDNKYLDAYDRSNDDITPFPVYTIGEKIKCGFITDSTDKKLSTYLKIDENVANYTEIPAVDDNPKQEILTISGIRYKCVLLYDMNEFTRTRGFGGGGSTGEGGFVSRWI